MDELRKPLVMWLSAITRRFRPKYFGAKLFKPALVAKYPLEPWPEIEDFFPRHSEKFYRKIVADVAHREPKDLFGKNAIVYLLQCLARSRSLLAGFVGEMNGGGVVPAFLIVRGHMEMAAGVAFLKRKYLAFRDQRISFDQLDKWLYKLSLGSGSIFADPSRPDAVNVMTLLDEATKEFPELKSPTFRQAYELLCEFVHPNFLGLALSSRLPKVLDGTVTFSKCPAFDDKTIKILVPHMGLSNIVFLQSYEELFDMLETHERMPVLER